MKKILVTFGNSFENYKIILLYRHEEVNEENIKNELKNYLTEEILSSGDLIEYEILN
jgi:hypothetical protein